MNTIGNRFRLTTFGESHGPAMGGIIDGMPSKVRIDMAEIQAMIDRRRTGQNPLTSQRRETDIPEILSGINDEGLTLGTPIGFIFRNSDHRSSDYAAVEERYRPNHADRGYDLRYGIRDHRGGGRSSARETVSWVMGGAMAMQWLKTFGLEIEAKVTEIGGIGYDNVLDTISMAGKDARLPFDDRIEDKMLLEVGAAREARDSVGGIVTCIVRNCPAGLGTPVFDKLHSRLAAAMMGINAAKGFEYGLGFVSSRHRGSEILDNFNPGFEPSVTSTNYSGGVQGGISTGMPIFFSVAFKPTPTIARELMMPDRDGNQEQVVVRGRHDPCVALRAPVIVESLAAMVVADMILSR